MRRLRKSDREVIDAYFRQQRWDTFYHYFPLMYAISETGPVITFEPDAGRLWVVPDEELYCPSWGAGYFQYPTIAEKVWVGPHPCPMRLGRSELYDVNYIYDLERTLRIKNFRKNVRRFEREHRSVSYEVLSPDDSPIARYIVERWYEISKRSEFTDFGYTMWLSDRFGEFHDLRARVVYADGEPVAFSLWGVLRPGLGVHLVCKDVGWPYLQDYARYMTYREMLGEGLVMANDGSDCNEHGIRMYKLKLRPRFIVPIWSWVRE